MLRVTRASMLPLGAKIRNRARRTERGPKCRPAPVPCAVRQFHADAVMLRENPASCKAGETRLD